MRNIRLVPDIKKVLQFLLKYRKKYFKSVSIKNNIPCIIIESKNKIIEIDHINTDISTDELIQLIDNHIIL